MRLQKTKFKLYQKTNSNIWGAFRFKKTLKKKWTQFNPTFKIDSQFEQNEESLKKYFKLQTIEKKKFRSFYNFIPIKTLKKSFNSIKHKKPINTYLYFCQHLESRLDIILLRLLIFSSIFAVNQNIQHGRIKVNNTKVKASNRLLKPGDIITFEPKTINPIILKNYRKNNKLNYLNFDLLNNSCTFLRSPTFKEITFFCLMRKKFILNYFFRN